MMEKIMLSETVIVEGKYDRIRLSDFLDAPILELGGFRIYNSRERLELIRKIADRTGIIILTDSDTAGFRLRHYLCSAVPPEKVKNIYIPSVPGKEKRKSRPGKEKLIGVEGMTTESLLEAFRKAGITPGGNPERTEPLTKAQLYEMGLSGKADSAEKRRRLCGMLDIPKGVSANALCEILPVIAGRDEILEMISKL